MYRIECGNYTQQFDNLYSAKLECRRIQLLTEKKICHILKNDILIIVSENNDGQIIDHEMSFDDNIYYGANYELLFQKS